MVRQLLIEPGMSKTFATLLGLVALTGTAAAESYDATQPAPVARECGEALALKDWLSEYLAMFQPGGLRQDMWNQAEDCLATLLPGSASHALDNRLEMSTHRA